MNPNDDDQAWLDLLAGRSVPDADAATRRQALRLRAALQAPAPLPAGPEPDRDARTRRLLQRAQDAGVLAPRSSPSGRLRHWLRPGLWGSGAVAAVLVVVLVSVAPPGPAPGDADGPGAERGADVQALQRDDPQAARDRLLADLRATGLDAQPYERLGRPGLDIQLPRPLAPEQLRALTAAGLVVPAGPVLRVEFNAPAARP